MKKDLSRLKTKLRTDHCSGVSSCLIKQLFGSESCPCLSQKSFNDWVQGNRLFHVKRKSDLFVSLLILTSKFEDDPCAKVFKDLAKKSFPFMDEKAQVYIYSSLQQFYDRQADKCSYFAQKDYVRKVPWVRKVIV